MQQLINEISEQAKLLNGNAVAIAELYDKYAPAVYGKIIRVVKQKDVAEKILEKVFVNALVDKNIEAGVHLTPLTTLLNHSRKKTYSTLKAIRMFQATACGYEGATPLILKNAEA